MNVETDGGGCMGGRTDGRGIRLKMNIFQH